MRIITILSLYFSALISNIALEPIVGGRLVKNFNLNFLNAHFINSAHEYQFIVSLQQAKNNSISNSGIFKYNHFCGGSLLNSHWILTAAHCLYKKDLRQIVAVVGQVNLTTAAHLEGNHYALDRVEFIYYQPKDFRNDIALVHMNQKYFSPLEKFGLNIWAKLPSLGMRAHREEPCKVIGYGAVKHGGEVQDTLREAKMYVIRNRVCRTILGHVWGPQRGSNSFCALGNNQDSCQGDSGGALLCKYQNKYYVYGIVSHGLTCGLINAPSVYMSTIPYLQWIQLIIRT